MYSVRFLFWSSHKFLFTLYFKFLKPFLSPVQEDKDDCLKYFSLTSSLYSVTSVEGHGLWVSKNTVVKELIDWGLCENRWHRRVFEPKTEQLA